LGEGDEGGDSHCRSAYSARRMVKEYTERMYIPAMKASEQG
jgi:hypothetical protein